jgi:hypothetical protein
MELTDHFTFCPLAILFCTAIETIGERLFLDSSAPSLVSKVIIAPGLTKTCKQYLVLEYSFSLTRQCYILFCLKHKMVSFTFYVLFLLLLCL